jgi:hypothetical protein
MHKKNNILLKQYIKILFNKDLFLTINYWNIEDFSKAILLSKMPFLGVLFVWDKNFFLKVVNYF